MQVTRILADLPDADKGCVALHDLGYLSLHGNCPFIDIWGLGSQDAAERNIANAGKWSFSDIADLFSAHDVRYAVLYETWYPRRSMPDGTVDVGYLTLADNYACGSDKVVFRATSPSAAEALKRHLSRFVGKLPATRASLFVYP